MTGLRFLAVFCVFLIQRAATQSCSCQSELYISIDDLINALNKGPGIPGLTTQGQPCGCQQSSSQQSGSIQSCGCNQPSQSQPSISISSGQCGCNRPIGQPCGCQQSINQPLSISSLPLSFSSQPSQPISISTQPVTLNLQSCGNQPSVSLSQPCGCNQPSISLSQPCGCNQPSISLSQPCGCNQPSISLNQPCGCNQPSLSRSQPSISFQPVSLGNQISVNTVQSQAGCNQPSQSCNQVAISSDYDNVAIVPAALLQAPPYGIFFAGENLLIDGAVQVCGNLPFNSVVELGGIVPTTGSGCVQYVCNDACS